jgi:hypothetical protein
MKRIYSIALVAFMAVGLLMIGCGGPPDIEGTWVAATCVPDAEPGFSTLYTNVYDAGERTSTIASYFGAECADDPWWEFESVADYVIGDETDVEGTWEIDYTFTAATLTVFNELAIPGFNDGVCGYTDWTVGEAEDVFENADCDFYIDGSAATLQVYRIASDGAALYVSDEVGDETGPGERNEEMSLLVFELELQ